MSPSTNFQLKMANESPGVKVRRFWYRRPSAKKTGLARTRLCIMVVDYLFAGEDAGFAGDPAGEAPGLAGEPPGDAAGLGDPIGLGDTTGLGDAAGGLFGTSALGSHAPRTAIAAVRTVVKIIGLFIFLPQVIFRTADQPSAGRHPQPD